jgi:glycosyltransferase involved in cell wall biosynthesis
MEKPLFSIIIPALNEEKFLPRLLESLAKQTYRNFEVIVVDGKSKDKTVLLAKTYMSMLPALTVRIADHASLPYQRNVGASIAIGTWYIFIDADTVVLPYCLEQIESYVQTHDVSFLTSWCQPDSEDGNDARFTLLTNLYFESIKAMKRPTSPGPFTVVTKSVFDRVGGYDVDHPFLEDQDFTQRIIKIGVPFHIIRETLYTWSLRRYRKEGTLRVLQVYAKSLFPTVFLRKTPKNLVGYTMGGHLYSKKKITVKSSLLSKTEKQIRLLMQDLFE